MRAMDWLEPIGLLATLIAGSALLIATFEVVRLGHLGWDAALKELGLTEANRAWAVERISKNYLWVMILLGSGFYIALWSIITWELPVLADRMLGELGGTLDAKSDAQPLNTDDIRNLAYAIGALLGGTALLATVPFQLIKTWMNERQATTAEQGHITDRITKAIEQLGVEKTVYVDGQPSTQPNIEVRLGAIYALERIAQDSERDHIPIMETLCAYIRENAPASKARTWNLAPLEWMPKDMTEAEREQRDAEFELRLGAYSSDPTSNLNQWLATLTAPRADVQAALTVIGRREERRRKYEKKKNYRLDLSATSLQHANLGEAHLERADIGGAHLEGADLEGAHLEGADFIGSHLERTYLEGAHLEGAYLGEAHLGGADIGMAHLNGALLGEAHLERAFLGRARLEGADLEGAHLERAFLRGAHLEGAGLRWAYLEGVDLVWANLEGADLGWANLKSADLSRCHMARTRLRSADFTDCATLTQQAVNQAFGDAATVLPEHLERPDHWDDEVVASRFEDKAYDDWIARGAPASQTGMDGA